MCCPGKSLWPWMMISALRTWRVTLRKHQTPEIFKTDYGVQYTVKSFTGALINHSIKISMEGKGCCMDNIFHRNLMNVSKVRKDFSGRVWNCSGITLSAKKLFWSFTIWHKFLIFIKIELDYGINYIIINFELIIIKFAFNIVARLYFSIFLKKGWSFAFAEVDCISWKLLLFF